MNAIKTNYWKSIVPRRVPPFLIGEPFGSKRVSFLTRHFENCFQTFQSTTCFSFVSVRQWYSLRYKCSYCSSRWREGCVTNHVKGYRWRREKTRAPFLQLHATVLEIKRGRFTPWSFQMEVASGDNFRCTVGWVRVFWLLTNDQETWIAHVSIKLGLP